MNHLRFIGIRLRDEFVALAAWLRSPGLWQALAFGMLLWTLAYQALPGVNLAIGGELASRRREFDAPFLHGFNASEPANRPDAEWWAQDAQPYRWASDSAQIEFPAIGGQTWIVRLHAASGRPDGSAATVRWRIGDSQPGTIAVSAGPRTYAAIGPTVGGALRFHLESERFTAPGDPRNLGLVLFKVHAQPLDTVPVLPPWQQLLMLGGCLIGIYGTAARLSLADRSRRFSAASMITLTLAGLAAMLLVGERPAFTVATPALMWLALIAYLVSAILLPFVHRLVAALNVPADPAEIGAALGCVLAAFLVRMGGMVNPYALFSDVGFHVNNLLRTGGGRIFLLAGLPCEAGAGQAPYPPAQYLALLPAALIGGGWQETQWLVQGANALLESLSALLIWLMLRSAGNGRLGALLGATLYIAAAPILRSYSVGEMANIFGQALIAPLLLFLMLCAPHADRRRIVAIGGVLLAVTLLSHTGVSISSAALLCAWLPLWWRAAHPTRSMLASLALAGMLAVGTAILFFYSSYLFLPEQNRANAAQLATQGLHCPPGIPLDQKLIGTLTGAFRPEGALTPLLAIPSLLGIALTRHRTLRPVLIAALIGTLLSFATLFASDQAVRWQLFLYPALCIGGGIFLGALARRGVVGRGLAYILAGTICWYGLAYWVRQIAEYLH